MNATTVHVTVDESPVEVPEGATVLDAVNRLGIPLPQLCKDPDRAPLGACRTCLVHVEGQRGVPAACHLPARDGMVVSTAHPEAVRVRRAVLDLTLSMLTPSAARDGFGQLGAAASPARSAATRPRGAPPASRPTRPSPSSCSTARRASSAAAARWPAATSSTSAPSRWPAAATTRASASSPTAPCRPRSAPPAGSAWPPAPPARSGPRKRRSPIVTRGRDHLPLLRRGLRHHAPRSARTAGSPSWPTTCPPTRSSQRHALREGPLRDRLRPLA